MKRPNTPAAEAQRQSAVETLELRGGDKEAFERIARLAAAVVDAPVSAFAVIDGDSLVFVSGQGDLPEAIEREYAICSHTILQDELFVVADTTEHPWFRDNPYVTEGPRIRFYAGAPIRDRRGNALGTLCVTDFKPRELTLAQRQALDDLRVLMENEILLRYLSTRDYLTGLRNRRSFDDLMDQEWQRARRRGRPLGLLALDVDHFKPFNDAFGHEAGDTCLQAIADVLNAQCRRAGDRIFRIGGEEFSVLLAETTPDEAEHVAEGIRRAVEELGFDNPAVASNARITVSVGGVVMKAVNASPVADLDQGDFVRRADQNLYQAKRAGRNRVVVESLDTATAKRRGDHAEPPQ